MNNECVKQDPVSQIANEIAENLVNNFTPEDQRNILQMAQQNVNEHYERRLSSAKENLESIDMQYSTFRGEARPVR